MIEGDENRFTFLSRHPGISRAPGTRGANGEPTSFENGYQRCGSDDEGHFVKMAQNGIEYGLMAALAEGLNIIRNANEGKHQREINADAETTVLRHPEHYQYNINLKDVSEVCRRSGRVISDPHCADATVYAGPKCRHAREAGDVALHSREGVSHSPGASRMMPLKNPLQRLSAPSQIPTFQQNR
jgi:6-phosphogluconate dehydrogenase (decarboxylating)